MSEVGSKPATPVVQSTTTPLTQQANGSTVAAPQVAYNGFRGAPQVKIGSVGLLNGFQAGAGFQATKQPVKPLLVKMPQAPQLGKMQIVAGVSHEITPIVPRPMQPAAPLAPLSMPTSMVLPHLQTHVPKGPILKTSLQLNYPETPEEEYYPNDLPEEPQTPAEQQAEFECDMEEGRVVGDFPENFSAEQEEDANGEEAEVLEREQQMEDQIEAEEAAAVVEAEEAAAAEEPAVVGDGEEHVVEGEK